MATETTRHVYHLGDHLIECVEKQGSRAFELVAQGTEPRSSMDIHEVVPGIKAAFYEYNSPHCHLFNDMAIARDIVGDLSEPHTMLEINVCREGTFRVIFPERRSFTSLLQGDISLTTTTVSDQSRIPAGDAEADWSIDLPTSRYRGFGLIIDCSSVAHHAQTMIDTLGIDIMNVIRSYHLEERGFILKADQGMEKTVDALELHKQTGSTPLLRLSALEFLARIEARAVPGKSLVRPECSLETARLVQEARNHAVNHLERRYTIEEISRSYGMSPTVFKNTFKELYGEPYAQYVTRIRMERAEALLAEGELVLSVAEAVGYESPSKFTAAFKRSYGTSPSTYRDRMKT